MKKYTVPIIKIVKLNLEQAVLQVCKVGGDYFVTGGVRCIVRTIGTNLNVCPFSVRGKNFTVGTMGYTQGLAMPS